MKRQRLKRASEIWRDLLTPEECLDQFKNRLTIKLRHPYAYITNQSAVEDHFALISGYPLPPRSILDGLDSTDFFTEAFDRSLVKHALEKSPNLSKVCFVLECLLSSVQKGSSRELASLERAIRDAVDLSPGIRINISVRSKEISIRPEGDQLLDKHVVDEVLVFLEKHASVSKHFKEALGRDKDCGTRTVAQSA